MPEGAPGVTVLVARRVAPGREEEFLTWERELTRAAAEYAGFLGSGLLRPVGAGHPWHVVYRFDTDAHLAAWEASGIRAELLGRADRLVQTVGVHRVSGLETWFALPGRTAPAPPRWKMFAVSAACIYVLQFVIYNLVGPVVDAWPLAARLIAVVPAVTALMTWFVMPRLTRVLGRWLYPPSH